MYLLGKLVSLKILSQRKFQASLENATKALREKISFIHKLLDNKR